MGASCDCTLPVPHNASAAGGRGAWAVDCRQTPPGIAFTELQGLSFNGNVVIRDENLQHSLFQNDPFWGFFWVNALKIVFLSTWMGQLVPSAPGESPLHQASQTSEVAGIPHLLRAGASCGAGLWVFPGRHSSRTVVTNDWLWDTVPRTRALGVRWQPSRQCFFFFLILT